MAEARVGGQGQPRCGNWVLIGRDHLGPSSSSAAMSSASRQVVWMVAQTTS